MEQSADAIIQETVQKRMREEHGAYIEEKKPEKKAAPAPPKKRGRPKSQ